MASKDSLRNETENAVAFSFALPVPKRSPSKEGSFFGRFDTHCEGGTVLNPITLVSTSL
jgi:hypothetical protein